MYVIMYECIGGHNNNSIQLEGFLSSSGETAPQTNNIFSYVTYCAAAVGFCNIVVVVVKYAVKVNYKRFLTFTLTMVPPIMMMVVFVCWLLLLVFLLLQRTSLVKSSECVMKWRQRMEPMFRNAKYMKHKPLLLAKKKPTQ